MRLLRTLMALYWERRSRQAYELDEMSAALDAGRRLLAHAPHHPWGLFLAACESLENEDYAGALERLEMLRPAWPDDPWTVFAQGVCLDQLDRFLEARVCYQRTLMLAPDWDIARKNLGRSLYLTGRFREAEPYLREYCRRKPDDKEAHDLLGYVCYALGRYQESFGHYGKALALDPFDAKMDRNARLLYRRSATS